MAGLDEPRSCTSTTQAPLQRADDPTSARGRRRGAHVAPATEGRERSRRAAPLLLLLGALLAADAFVLLGDVAHRYANPQGRPLNFAGERWDSQWDGSFAEVLGYAQVGVAVLLVAVAAVRRRAAVFAAWGVLLLAVVLDDALRVHERLGFALARAVNVPAIAGLRAGDLGELLVWSGYGATLGLLVLVLHRRSTAAVRRSSWWLAGGLVFLTMAAAGLDMVHQVAGGAVSDRVGYTLGLMESAGELSGMSLILVAAVAAAVNVDLLRPCSVRYC